MTKNKVKKSRKGGFAPAIGGAKIKVSFWVVLMAAIAIATGHLREILSYAAAVILHEFAHATVAARLGYTLDCIKIMPYGAALTGEFETARPRDEFLIAIAGPLSNVVFSVLFVAVWWLVPSLFYYTEIYVLANVFTALVNLLPIFPLDGGRAALALLSVRFERGKAYKAMRVLGLVLGVAGIALAAVFFRRLNFSYFSFLVFVFASSVFPDKSNTYRRLYGMSYRMKKIRSGLTVREIMVHRDTTLIACSKLLSPNYYARFTVTDDTMKCVGTLSETQLEDCLVKFPISATLGETVSKLRKD